MIKCTVISKCLKEPYYILKTIMQITGEIVLLNFEIKNSFNKVRDLVNELQAESVVIFDSEINNDSIGAVRSFNCLGSEKDIKFSYESLLQIQPRILAHKMLDNVSKQELEGCIYKTEYNKIEIDRESGKIFCNVYGKERLSFALAYFYKKYNSQLFAGHDYNKFNKFDNDKSGLVSLLFGNYS